VSALERWRRELAGWAIPDGILANAPESPWGFAPEPFRRRAERARADTTISTRRALEALGDRGEVLDVGIGGGATSLPLAPRASRITGVDGSADMLEGFLASAAETGVEATAVEGRWPDVGSDVGPADVVVCGHVLYNVGELEPFVRALHDHARRRVVVEITSAHPLAWMADLWTRFHALERPVGPRADVAFEAIEELGIGVRREGESRSPRSGGFERRNDAVALVRRRLCLTAARDADIADALGDRLAERDGLWAAGPAEHPITTLWWDRD
jgi:SAM-dependent methyltransferase